MALTGITESGSMKVQVRPRHLAVSGVQVVRPAPQTLEGF